MLPTSCGEKLCCGFWERPARTSSSQRTFVWFIKILLPSSRDPPLYSRASTSLSQHQKSIGSAPRALSPSWTVSGVLHRC